MHADPNCIFCKIVAGQSVFHFHIHILPRRIGDDLEMNWGHVPGDMAAIKADYEKIRAAMA